MPKSLVVIGHLPGTLKVRTVVTPHDLDADDWDDFRVHLYVDWLRDMGQRVFVGSLAEYRELGAEELLRRHLKESPSSSSAMPSAQISVG